MSMYSILEDPPQELWDSVLGSLAEGNFWQTMEYGEITRRAFPRTMVARLLAVDRGEPVGIVQGTYSRYFGFGTCLVVHSGPVTKVEDGERFHLVKHLLTTLEDFGVRNRVISARVWWPDGWGLHEVFRELGYVPVGKFNLYTVNLEKPVEDLWKSIDYNKRKNVRKASNEGVEVVETCRYDDLLGFYRMLEASAKTHGFPASPLSWFEAMWEVFRPGESSRIFLAKWNGRGVSGVFTVVHGRTVYALAAGSLSEGWKVRPNDLLHWKVMEWACERHFSRYYMGLVDDPVPTEESKSWGIWRWKREWKGDLEVIRIFDKLYLPKYRHVLGIKRLVERGYEGIKSLSI